MADGQSYKNLLTIYLNTQDSKVITVSLKKGIKVIDSLNDQNEFGSEVLLPLVTQILLKNNLTLKDLKAVQLETGPGSFTGLKVGASIAQALGFALGLPVNGKYGKPVKIRYT